MTYSYGRALQQKCFETLVKKYSRYKGYQEIFNHRARMCTLAAKGEWSKELEKKN